ncbi:MAG: PAS domain-containing sensor histidine kinase [Ignavibacteriales bacterium]|nr:PAS domain-containing sensor histidine kinase [Ignavibacteriales bacterium]
MSGQKLETLFASAERSTATKLNEERLNFSQSPLLFEITNAIPNGVLVLNNNRQIVYANKHVLDIFALKNDSTLIGMRPGEALNCEHSFDMEGGCGTSEHCQTCGAVMAILNSQHLNPDIQECRILQKNTGIALDYRIWTTPLHLKEDLFTIFSIQDIQDEKRRKVLERIFFHDIMNTASGLKGISEIMVESKDEEFEEYKNILYSLTDRLIDEIKTQRELLAAENNELDVNMESFHTLSFLNEVEQTYRQYEIAKNKIIRTDPSAADIKIASDKVLLWRVITNMLKNAIEASTPNQTITIGCNVNSNTVEFWVHNPNFMKREIQLQIFQRSFTTKGRGRGIGTYSIKLLTEGYLKGKVRFISSEVEGTTFFAAIPIHP